jgi:hypothetical protein
LLSLTAISLVSLAQRERRQSVETRDVAQN